MTMTMTTTELDQLIKAFVKTLEEANIITTTHPTLPARSLSANES